jgi:hypothetical protein
MRAKAMKGRRRTRRESNERKKETRRTSRENRKETVYPRRKLSEGWLWWCLVRHLQIDCVCLCWWCEWVGEGVG